MLKDEARECPPRKMCGRGCRLKCRQIRAVIKVLEFGENYESVSSKRRALLAEMGADPAFVLAENFEVGKCNGG